MKCVTITSFSKNWGSIVHAVEALEKIHELAVGMGGDFSSNGTEVTVNADAIYITSTVRIPVLPSPEAEP